MNPHSSFGHCMMVLPSLVRDSVFRSLATITALGAPPVLRRWSLFAVARTGPTMRVKVDRIRQFVPLNAVARSRLRLGLVQQTFLWPGNWDLQSRDISLEYSRRSTSYRTVWQVFSEGMPFQQSDEYKRLVSLLQQTGKTPRGNSISEIHQYFHKLALIALKMEAGQYHSEVDFKVARHDEIGVAVGRHGELLKMEDKFGGTHRLALAHVLKLSHVTVQICAVHPKFVHSNQQMLTSETKPEMLAALRDAILKCE